MQNSPLIMKISNDLLMPPESVYEIANSAHYRYKVYQIKKRTGGSRTIAQPASEVKYVQYWVISKILKALPVHSCAYGYIKDRNIYKNAKIHAGNNFLLKMDFSNFFPSIVPNDFQLHLEKYYKHKIDDQDMFLLKKILFWKSKIDGTSRLSIGSPSSPMLSNTIMYDFDTLVFEFCKENDVAYTRYADDITFSTKRKNVLDKVKENIEKICSNVTYPELRINPKKTIFSSKKSLRRVTGLVLTNDGNVSLGRDRKRNISCQINYFLKGKLGRKEIYKLKGLLSFASDVEPEFIDRMKNKYGEAVFKDLFEYY